MIGGPIDSYDAPEERGRVGWDLERSIHSAGIAQQMAAIVADGGRRELLEGVTTPRTVVHGEADPLMTMGSGRDKAASIKDAELIVIPDVGHCLQLLVLDQFVNAIVKTVARAKGFSPSRKTMAALPGPERFHYMTV